MLRRVVMSTEFELPPTLTVRTFAYPTISRLMRLRLYQARMRRRCNECRGLHRLDELSAFGLNASAVSLLDAEIQIVLVTELEVTWHRSILSWVTKQKLP